MSRKLYAAFVPLFAVAAFAVLPAVAQAQPHWYSNGTRIAYRTTPKVAATSHGTLKLEALGKYSEGECKNQEKIWNPSSTEPGKDEVTVFECPVSTGTVCPEGDTIEIEATKLPWLTELYLNGAEIRNRFIKVEFDVKCSGTLLDTFEGTTSAKVVNGTPFATCATTKTYLEFEALSEELEDAAHNKAKITGKVFILGPSGDECITVKNP